MSKCMTDPSSTDCTTDYSASTTLPKVTQFLVSQMLIFNNHNVGSGLNVKMHDWSIIHWLHNCLLWLNNSTKGNKVSKVIRMKNVSWLGSTFQWWHWNLQRFSCWNDYCQGLPCQSHYFMLDLHWFHHPPCHGQEHGKVYDQLEGYNLLRTIYWHRQSSPPRQEGGRMHDSGLMFEAGRERWPWAWQLFLD